uniref:HRDC domain-containing protein n=1 Tax=Leptocylindrus danicus TaxID=163516 RepID=A0A6U2S7D2_9STRA|mmetsp:Transcript_5007/g.7345  ORF Transcript_5007/g.7345 Transcript_5007/m.7345 type:complete len:638 (+) Transcript_5007:216-2129(+)|eukprot:CAMPEP_0116027002 /NCGR_PEP_ID=MMETSP0321-20121206/14310_1 /TAXON_ID=163516 /ORGANISM="Leptocylindrus danicus var. danicus, Strain B650" /LENGTH=637 /DNA_ID=CAMNT_0003500155 /DNA_START=201 /DNA_END=2117 /DNA_ORIENTATION=-
MGRGRKRRNFRGRNSSGGNDPFTPYHMEQIETYLLAYLKKDTETNDFYVKSFTIEKHAFPKLELDDGLYITLPDGLSNKQRRIVHEICSYVGLYHGSIDVEGQASSVPSDHPNSPDICDNKETIKKRACVIARVNDAFGPLYSSGRLAIPSPQLPVSVRELKPWFYRQHSRYEMSQSTTVEFVGDVWNADMHVKKTTKKMRATLMTLVDYPDKCLNDATSRKVKSHDDLSTVSSISDHPMLFVDSVEKLEKCAQEISGAKEFAFDLEMHNPSPYYGMVCLLQLATIEKDYVIDVFAPGVWGSVGRCLRKSFEDSSVVKVGHAIGGMDVPALHRDFGIFVVNAFDTYEAARTLRMEKVGLAALCEYYKLESSEEYAKLKSQYQRCDWRKRPLSEPMIQYGRYDVRYLIYLRQLLIRDLSVSYWGMYAPNGLVQVENGRVEEQTEYEAAVVDSDAVNRSVEIDAVIEENNVVSDSLIQALVKSQKNCLRFWAHKEEVWMKNDQIISAIRRNKWTKLHSRLFEDLVKWRYKVAISEEIMPQIACPTSLLISVVRGRPTCESSLRRINPFLPELLEDEKCNYIEELLVLVRASFDDDYLQDEKEQRPSSSKTAFYVPLFVGCGIALAVTATAALALRRSRR